jgi:hypothetical protein
MLSTSRARELRDGGDPRGIPSELLDKLAQDAVRSDARGFRGSVWWGNTRGCDVLAADAPDHSPLRSLSGVQRILYDADDPIARDIAERIVALAASDPAETPETAAYASAIPGLVGGAARIVADGVTSAALAQGLRAGDDFGYVVSLPLRPAERCYSVRRLLKRAPWLAGVDLSEALIPLVEADRHAIVDAGKTGLAVDWNNRVYVTSERLEVNQLP